jgi:hypothetical protein
MIVVKSDARKKDWHFQLSKETTSNEERDTVLHLCCAFVNGKYSNCYFKETWKADKVLQIIERDKDAHKVLAIVQKVVRAKNK